MKKIIIILIATLLSFSALNAEQYHLKTSSGQTWKSVYSKKYMQYVAEINIEHHKLTVLLLENKLRLLFKPIFYYDQQISKYGKVTNYYYKHQYGVNVDGSPFSVWQTCVDLHVIEGKPCEKTAQYYMMDLKEKDINILKKGNEIWYDTSTFTDDLTFTFSLKGFTKAFNESFAKSIKQAEKSLKQAEEELDRIQEKMIANRQRVNKLVEKVNVQLPVDIVGGAFTLERFTLKEDMSLRAEITPQSMARVLLVVPDSAHLMLKKDFCRIDISKLYIDTDNFEYIFTWKDKIIKKKITECNEK